MLPVRFDMPAVFGPSLMPDQSRIAQAEAISISFETTRDAAARLLPRHFSLADDATVTVSRMDYQGLEYLGGRGYREVVISVAAVHESPQGRLHAGFAPVMWVSEVGALIGGREFMGFAKLPGEMAPIEHSPDGRAFQCAEYGHALIEGRVRDMVPLSDQALARVRQRSACVETFGWKLIAGAAGTPDLDYPLVNVMRWDYRQAWSGVGEVVFHRPAAADAPLSSRVVAALASLPVQAYRRAFVGVGGAVIDRAATRRLEPVAA